MRRRHSRPCLAAPDYGRKFLRLSSCSAFLRPSTSPWKPKSPYPQFVFVCNSSLNPTYFRSRSPRSPVAHAWGPGSCNASATFVVYSRCENPLMFRDGRTHRSVAHHRVAGHFHIIRGNTQGSLYRPDQNSLALQVPPSQGPRQDVQYLGRCHVQL